MFCWVSLSFPSFSFRFASGSRAWLSFANFFLISTSKAGADAIKLSALLKLGIDFSNSAKRAAASVERSSSPATNTRIAGLTFNIAFSKSKAGAAGVSGFGVTFAACKAAFSALNLTSSSWFSFAAISLAVNLTFGAGASVAVTTPAVAAVLVSTALVSAVLFAIL